MVPAKAESADEGVGGLLYQVGLSLKTWDCHSTPGCIRLVKWSTLAVISWCFVSYAVRVVTPGRCLIDYMDRTGCHQFVFQLQNNMKSANLTMQPSYQASSPDEEALVMGAALMGNRLASNANNQIAVEAGAL